MNGTLREPYLIQWIIELYRVLMGGWGPERKVRLCSQRERTSRNLGEPSMLARQLGGGPAPLGEADKAMPGGFADRAVTAAMGF